MKKIIHHLRNQPEEVRKHILHVLIIFAGIILIILWSYSFGKSFNSSETQVNIKHDLAPFSVLKDNLVVGGDKNTSVPTDDVVR